MTLNSSKQIILNKLCKEVTLCMFLLLTLFNSFIKYPQACSRISYYTSNMKNCCTPHFNISRTILQSVSQFFSCNLFFKYLNGKTNAQQSLYPLSQRLEAPSSLVLCLESWSTFLPKPTNHPIGSFIKFRQFNHLSALAFFRSFSIYLHIQLNAIYVEQQSYDVWIFFFWLALLTFYLYSSYPWF